jgi:hypothetical protein
VRSRGEPTSSSVLNDNRKEGGRELHSSPLKSIRLSRDGPLREGKNGLSATLEQLAAPYVVCSICYIYKKLLGHLIELFYQL